MKNKIRIVIADDYTLFREGVYLMLSQQEKLEVVGEAKNGKDLLQVVKNQQPDVAITDIEMPEMNGIEATIELRKKYPLLGIIALTMFGEDRLIVDMLEAGANGYLLKNAGKHQLIEACELAAEGKSYFCNQTSMLLSKLIASNNKLSLADLKQKRLTEKETEVVRLICEQYATKEIAGLSKLTEATVNTYRGIIMEKIGVRNIAGIVIYAIRNGIYKI
jgi:DNA-binding NarL/FixJ family response regulator